MSQIPSRASIDARRARTEYDRCPVCQTKDVTGLHVDRCEEKKRYVDRSVAAGLAAGVPEVTVRDLHAHAVSRTHNHYMAALVVEAAIDLGWRPVVGSTPRLLWSPQSESSTPPAPEVRDA